MSYSRPNFNSLFYYIQYNEKTKLSDIDNFTSLCMTLQKMNIKINESSLRNMPVNKDDKLYKMIYSSRQKSAESLNRFSNDENAFLHQKELKPIYTEHAYKIVRYFSAYYSKDYGKSMYGYKEIFLTYAKSISLTFKK